MREGRTERSDFWRLDFDLEPWLLGVGWLWGHGKWSKTLRTGLLGRFSVKPAEDQSQKKSTGRTGTFPYIDMDG